MEELDIEYSDSFNYIYDYEPDLDFEDEYRVVESFCHLFQSVCLILILCISVPGNSFLLWVLLRERAWKTIPGIWHLQLTTSDLCLTLTLPFQAYRILHDLMFEDWIWRVFIGSFNLGLNSYVLILTAMTLSHYVAVVQASCLSAQAQQKCCLLISSIVIWLVCVAASIMMIVPLPFTMNNVLIIMFIGLFFLVPFIIMTFCCLHMLIMIKLCGTNRHHHALKLSLGMIVVFFVSLVPYNIICFIEYLMVIDVLEYTKKMYYARCIIYTLPYFHCFLNPLLHVVFGAQRFRSHLPVPCNTSSQRGDASHNHNTMAAIPPNYVLA